MNNCCLIYLRTYDEENKEALIREYAKLNPAKLKRYISALQVKLKKLAIKQREIEKKTAKQLNQYT